MREVKQEAPEETTLLASRSLQEEEHRQFSEAFAELERRKKAKWHDRFANRFHRDSLAANPSVPRPPSPSLPPTTAPRPALPPATQRAPAITAQGETLPKST